uniref:Uncharacterized protein n=1 Tax=Anthurium amnicola TaxID=1678845 RepID=A0A1D1Z3E6_9ARAE
MTKREAAVTFLLSLIFSVLVAASCSLIADDARGGIPAGMVHTDKPTASSATSTKKGGGGGHGGGASGGGRGGTGGNGVHGPRTPGAGIVVVGGVGASHGRKHSGGSRSRGNCLAAPVVVAVALGFTVTLAFV